MLRCSILPNVEEIKESERGGMGCINVFKAIKRQKSCDPGAGSIISGQKWCTEHTWDRVLSEPNQRALHSINPGRAATGGFSVVTAHMTAGTLMVAAYMHTPGKRDGPGRSQERCTKLLVRAGCRPCLL
jgi:hypothetical protein